MVENGGGRALPERVVLGTPQEPGPGELPRLGPRLEEEELLREMEELRSENDYLKVSGHRARWFWGPHLPVPDALCLGNLS